MIPQRNIMEKNTYTNNAVCRTLWLGGSWSLEVGWGVREEKNNNNKIFWKVVLLRRYSSGRGCPSWPSIQVGNARL